MNTAGKSSSTGESEGSRISMQKYMATWSVHVMGAEQNQLTRLSRRVKLALCLLVILATVGFSLIDLVSPVESRITLDVLRLRNPILILKPQAAWPFITTSVPICCTMRMKAESESSVWL